MEYAGKIAGIFLGAILNRVRGGLFNNRTGIFWGYFKKYDKILQPVLFGIITLNPLAGAAMWLGQSPGWGLYVGALGGFNKAGEEQSWIDCLIESLESRPRLWGFAGLSIRGVFWGTAIGLATLNPFMPFLGALMPLFYWPCMEVSKKLQSVYGRDKVQAEAGWAWSEWFWGGFIWGCSLLMQ